MKEKSSIRTIEPYGAKVEFVVSDNLNESRNTKDRIKRYGKYETKDTYYGLTARAGNKIMVMVHSKDVSHNTIAHEIFHLTHRILEYYEVNFDKDNHEAAAYLNGYLTELIYDDLKAWRIKIK